MRDKISRLDEDIDALRRRVRGVEDVKVGSEVFDKAMLLTLYKLANAGVIETLHGAIKTGKESNVFLAIDSENNPVAVKIHRVTTSDYKVMYKYVQGDYRFKKTKKTRRAIVYTWVEKEFKNLKIAKGVGVNVPEPIAAKNNVLVMEFIGDESPAPMLKQCELEDPKKVFKAIIKDVKTLYCRGNLVHGDLSEYNVLMSNGNPVIIDMSQGVIKEHPLAQELIVRDVKNITRFFGKYFRINEKKVFEKVTGCL